MSLRIKHNREEETTIELPAEGKHDAVTCDIFDKGIVDHKKYGPRHRFLIGWQLAEENPAFNEPFIVWKEYTLSLHSNSNFAQDLESWRGAPLDDLVDANGMIDVDIEKMLLTGEKGPVRATIYVKHSEDGRYANVSGVYPPRKSNKLEVSDKYVRKEIRDQERIESSPVSSSEDGDSFAPDDDLPF